MSRISRHPRVDEQRFYDLGGRETDFDTWINCRDDVGAEWVVEGERRVFVSTCFQGDETDGEVVLWETKVTRSPDLPFTAARYSTHDAAVSGHQDTLRSEAENLSAGG